MPQSKTIELTDHFEDFIDRQVDQGRFASASEVVEAGLRLLEERAKRLSTPLLLADEREPAAGDAQTEAERQAIAEALEAGEQSGNYHPVDFDRLFEEVADAEAGYASRAR